MIEQVSSGKFSGLVWDDEAKTMFRIPWKHAGKQDFRKDEDAAIFKAWAEFKGKLSDGGQDNPAIWKTRLRCALNKSPEFEEVDDRAQLDISEPYKVYRLVPLSEQGLMPPEDKSVKKPTRKSKRRSSKLESDDDDEDHSAHAKQIKTEDNNNNTCQLQCDTKVLTDEPVKPSAVTVQKDVVNEIRLDVRLEESVPALQEVHDSINVAVHYLGQEVLRRQILGPDVRITYLPSSLLPPTPSHVLRGRFPRITLPEPPAVLSPGPELQALQTLLPFMEKGVVLTSTQQGVYGKRYCQGRVFWRGPHTTTTGMHKMERDSEPVLLFSRDTFKQQLDLFCSNGGEAPPCGFTLCFGEELSEGDDTSRKLIIAQVTLPWAEQKVQNAHSLCEPINFLKSLASQSPLEEITLNLVAIPSPTDDTITWGML